MQPMAATACTFTDLLFFLSIVEPTTSSIECNRSGSAMLQEIATVMFTLLTHYNKISLLRRDLQSHEPARDTSPTSYCGKKKAMRGTGTQSGLGDFLAAKLKFTVAFHTSLCGQCYGEER